MTLFGRLRPKEEGEEDMGLKVMGIPQGVKVAPIAKVAPVQAVKEKAREMTRDELIAKRKALQAEQKAISAQLGEASLIKEPQVHYWEEKNRMILDIPLASGKPFSIGQAKARAIVEHYEAVKEFSEAQYELPDKAKADRSLLTETITIEA